MPTSRLMRSLIILVALTLIVPCHHDPQAQGTPKMAVLSPRLQLVFEKTKTICFGRFLIDLPSSATVVWGDADVPLGVVVYPDGADEVNKISEKFIGELKGEKAIYHDNVPLLISIVDTTEPTGRIVTGYEGFEAVNGLKINGYFRLNNDAFVIRSRPLRSRKDLVTSEIASMARRLRPLSAQEIPSGAGNCIEHAFIPDISVQDKEFLGEVIGIGFRLKEFPDTHISVLLTPSNPDYAQSNSLEWQLDQVENELRSESPNHPRLKTKYLRRGARRIHDWNDGFEALSHTPELPDQPSIYDFAMAFKGTPSNPLKPYADIRMQTGVEDDVAGTKKSNLTEEEAVAIWDKITSTLRVRPVTVTRGDGN